MAAATPTSPQSGRSRTGSAAEDDGSEKDKKVATASQESVSDTASDDLRAGEDGVVAEERSGPRRQQDGTEKQADITSMAIERRYFTFETPLPPVNNTVFTPKSRPANADNDDDDGPVVPPPPPPPDLTAFTDPHRWPRARKNLLLGLSCMATFLTAYSAGAFSPPVERMAAAFHVSQLIVLFAGITLFCVGFALAPMLLAPLSEYNGRYPVFVASGCVFVAFQVVCGASTTLATVLVGRVLVGIGSSVFSTMVGGVIADMWHAEGRNTPMALFSGAVILATGSGPLVSSVITHRTTAPYHPHDVATDPSLRAPWRWVFWHQAIADAVFMVFLVFLFRESRGSVLLSRRAQALNTWYEARERTGYYGVWMASAGESSPAGHETNDEEKAADRANKTGRGSGSMLALPSAPPPPQPGRLCRVRWVVKEDEDRRTLLHTVAVSVYRPFHMFFTEPVVFFFSLWVAFAWAVLYLTFGSIFFVFERAYGWDVETAGRAFSPMLIGAVLSTVMGIYQDRVLARVLPDALRARLRPDVPEARLYVACVTSALLPAGLFIFGFTARPDVHWIAPMVGVGVSTVGIYAVYLATFNYLADVYHQYASSALAAQSCCRNIMGGVFPLVMRALFGNLGNARAGALLGGVATGLTLVPWVLVFFGERIRRRSRFAMVRRAFSSPFFSFVSPC
ncbi:major facilitator superfamily transporter multidrug resistance [Niveomyces insectorum RCEF 264]|uniref:Major facilitator superfamily transporter multidrug resistance n=1 Tax=Niveomyces insectorum RCEF 264 TaxID=1081102 RepID=A0A167N007_9HYPO|nr:major facilitator superfamily transporter multidrug resistance [Niveomyces insectorum RCEF 264]